MTRIVLYSGAHLLLRRLQAALRRDAAFQVLPACGAVAALVAAAEEAGPVLVLADLAPEAISPVLAEMRDRAPLARTVLWAETISTETAMEAMKQGARGILRKTLPADLQVKCLRKVNAGELWFEKALAESVPAAQIHLDAGDARLISLLSEGLRNWEIAATLEIPESSVQEMLQRLFRTLGVKDRFELALFGLKNLPQHPRTVSPADAACRRDSSGVFRAPLAPTLQ
ncbi:MAG: response regulator transcription factor [Acidobacteriota bacterium]|nr:response regulator transcription factor [Acidobacteriota bacterium]